MQARRRKPIFVAFTLPSSSYPGRQLARQRMYAWPPRRWGFNGLSLSLSLPASLSWKIAEPWRACTRWRDAKEYGRYPLLIYESRAFPGLSRVSLQNLSDEMAGALALSTRNSELWRRGGEQHCSHTVVNRARPRRVERLHDVKHATGLLYLSVSSAERRGYIRIKVFSHSPMQSAPGSSGMSFRAISECDECSSVRISCPCIRSYSLDSARVRVYPMLPLYLYLSGLARSDHPIYVLTRYFRRSASPPAIEL